MVLAACAPATPEKVVETVVVEVAGTPVVQEKVITATPAEAVAEGPIAAEGLVPCNPLPELPTSVGASSSAVPIVSDVPKPQVPSYFKPQVGLQQAGKVYKVGVFEDVTSTNFFAANGPDNTVYNSYMLPGRLTLYSLTDKYFTFVPFVAKDFPAPLTQEGDFWVVEIPIREDITWSDGTPFTANDVAFTANSVLRMHLISGNFSQWYDGNFLDHMEATSDYVVKIFYHTKPGLARHEWGTLQAPIVQEAYWKSIIDEAAKPIEALAADATDEQKAAADQEAQDILFAHVPENEPQAGGFTLSKWEKGAFLEVAKFADYIETGKEVKQWANGAYEDSDGLKVGTPEGDVETSYTVGPNVDSVVYTVYGSQDAAILALKNGEVDFMLNSLGLQRGLANQIRNDPNLTVVENQTNGFRYLSFNTRRRPMNDCAFRQAMAVLIDKEFVTGTILQKVAFPLYTFIPEGNTAWYFTDTPKLGQGLDREQRTNLALAILEQAGYTWEGDQKPSWDGDNRQVVPAGRLLMPDGTPVPPLTMLAPSPGYDPLRSTFAIWIETWANEFGIPLKADLAGFNVIVPKIFTEQAFDMYILGWSLSLFPSFLRDFFSTEQAVPDGNNAGGYSNPEFDKMADGLLTCETNEACKKLSDDVQVMLATELPYVLLFDTGIIEAFSNNVEYPYTQQLSGLQYTHQQPCTLQTIVTVK
jgi:ABC-type transport system substrate-binding protein